jgi:ABC-type nitrate/sulfonate/bicarbonate transport system substrate-binding protein
MSIRVWLALALFPHLTQAAEVGQKIRVGLPSLALTYTPFYVAQEKRFLAKVGWKRNTFR